MRGDHPLDLLNAVEWLPANVNMRSVPPPVKGTCNMCVLHNYHVACCEDRSKCKVMHKYQHLAHLPLLL